MDKRYSTAEKIADGHAKKRDWPNSIWLSAAIILALLAMLYWGGFITHIDG
jgi:hypothetical protein